MAQKKMPKKKDDKTLYETFVPIKDLQGFDLYCRWRQINFEMIFQAIETKQKTKIREMSQTSDLLHRDIIFLIDAGFFHDSYKDNVKISCDLLISHLKEKEKEKEKFYANLNIIDKYIRPPTKKTADFNNAFNKGVAGLLAYKLSRSPDCSEHLALHISK